jgi:uncharacterized protein YdeI (YjbR/CyaY-like superfamily)
MSSLFDRFDEFHPLTRKEWRMWLSKNYDRSPGVWFVYYKKHTGRPRVSNDEAVEEALCFGWIDSLQRKLDEDRTKLVFTPRKPKSVWSKPNKERIERMIAAGQMTDAGHAKIERAKGDGSWNALDHSDNLTVPKDLSAALKKNKTALKNFESFSDSAKKMILYWLGTAKREETRLARIEKIVSMAAIGKRANFDKEVDSKI